MWVDDADLAAVADGLWLRVRDAILAERRLERFTFAPEAPAAGGGRGSLAALVDEAEAPARLSRDVTLRALAAASDPINCRILDGLDGPPVAMAELARRVGLPGLALSERVSALVQVGLAARDLEKDAVVPTAAGEGLAALVDAVAKRLAERLRRELPALLAS